MQHTSNVNFPSPEEFPERNPGNIPEIGRHLVAIMEESFDRSFRGFISAARCSSSFLEIALIDDYEDPEDHRTLRDSDRFPMFERLKDQVVIDLGAGSRALGYNTCVAAGAKAYVGVEAFNSGPLSVSVQHAIKKAGSEAIPATVIPRDMRQVLRGLPESSVSILAAGIEGTLFVGSEDSKVLNETSRLAARALSPHGALVSIYSEIGTRDLIWTKFGTYSDDYHVVTKLG